MVCTRLLALQFYNGGVTQGYTYSNGGDVGEVSSDTWGIDDIVKSKLINERAGFEEEGERLEIF